MPKKQPDAPDVTVTVDSNGDADDPTVLVGQWIQWALEDEVDGPFALSPPRNMFQDHDSPKCETLLFSNRKSTMFKVKQSATVGEHEYWIDEGVCPPKKKRILTGGQTITVDTSQTPIRRKPKAGSRQSGAGASRKKK